MKQQDLQLAFRNDFQSSTELIYKSNCYFCNKQNYGNYWAHELTDQKTELIKSTCLHSDKQKAGDWRLEHSCRDISLTPLLPAEKEP